MKESTACFAEAELRPVIFESWKRSRRAGVPSNPDHVLLTRVNRRDMEARLASNAMLVAAAIPAMEAYARTLGELKYALYITDADAVVLYSIGTATELLIWGLLPGYDWSEATMGTNGAGTAIAIGSPVAVVGPEHYSLPFHNTTCLGCPIRRQGKVIGAIDFSTHVSAADPAQLKDIVQVAGQIEQALLTTCEASSSS